MRRCLTRSRTALRTGGAIAWVLAGTAAVHAGALRNGHQHMRPSSAAVSSTAHHIHLPLAMVFGPRGATTSTPDPAPSPFSSPQFFQPTQTPPAPNGPPADVYANCIQQQEWDVGDDGRLDWVFVSTFGTDGALLERTTDDDADGVVDDVSRYTYNHLGSVTSWEKDAGADGTIDRFSQYRYADSGGLIEWVYHDLHQATRRDTRFLYWANGLLGESVAKDGDNRIVSRRLFSYDKVNRKSVESADLDGDSIDDVVWHHRYRDGRLAEIESALEGTTIAYTYRNGVLIGERLSATAGSAQSGELAIEHTYGADGFVVETKTLRNMRIESTMLYSYNGSGQLVQQRSLGEGGTDSVSFSYDCE